MGRPLAQDGQDASINRFEQRAPYAAAARHIIEDFSSPENTVNAIFKLSELTKRALHLLDARLSFS